MSTVRATELRCDGTGCDNAWIDYDSPAVLRARAARHGWTHPRPRTDLCPDCSGAT